LPPPVLAFCQPTRGLRLQTRLENRTPWMRRLCFAENRPRGYGPGNTAGWLRPPRRRPPAARSAGSRRRSLTPCPIAQDLQARRPRGLGCRSSARRPWRRSAPGPDRGGRF
jgi:hypothetical protein